MTPEVRNLCGCHIRIVQAIPQAGVAGQKRVDAEDVELDKETDQVPDVPGKLFGFYYQINGSEAQIGDTIQLTCVVRFPKPIGPCGDETKTKNKYVVPRTIGDTFFRGYAFDEEWEIALGEWTFEIWSDQSLLSTVKFNVYHDPNQPNHLGHCCS
jgi:hypothetical protein